VSEITETELATARIDWGDALIAISIAFDTEGIEAATEIANRALDAVYDYEFGPVLFKPTMAGGEHTFRTTREGALSYFVGHNPDFPQDLGFGLRSFMDGQVAMWMGSVTFLDKDGDITIVDKSWGYRKDASGTLRIVLHHSSLPYQPA
jgi:hypothetical protein